MDIEMRKSNQIKIIRLVGITLLAILSGAVVAYAIITGYVGSPI